MWLTMSCHNLKGRLKQSTSLSGQIQPETSLEANMSISISRGIGGGIYSPEITTIRVLDKAEYDALPIKDTATLYFLKG